MTERDLTKLVLSCCGALKETKDWDLRIASTSYAVGHASGEKKIIYHILGYNGQESRQFDLDFYLMMLDNVNTPKEQLALGKTIIARIYVQMKA